MLKQEPDIIDESIVFWGRRARRQLTREDAREIISNVTGFVKILEQWDKDTNKPKPSS